MTGGAVSMILCSSSIGCRCQTIGEAVSSWIELPCGCRINEAFVLGMCPQHAHELTQKQREAERAYALFERQMRCEVPQSALPSDKA
jgi:hypothetical protein